MLSAAVTVEPEVISVCACVLIKASVAFVFINGENGRDVECLVLMWAGQDSGVFRLHHRCRYDKDAIWWDSWLQSHGVNSLWDSVAAVKLPCCQPWTILLSTHTDKRKFRGKLKSEILQEKKAQQCACQIPTFFSSCFPCTSTKSPTTLTMRSSGLKSFTSTWTVKPLSSQFTYQHEHKYCVSIYTNIIPQSTTNSKKALLPPWKRTI